MGRQQPRPARMHRRESPIGARITEHPAFEGREWIAASLLVGAFVATRLWRLAILPAFIDESLHISWALEAWPFWRRVFASGKPLQLLLGSLVVGWVPSPLLGLRMLSALAGGAAMWSVFVLANRWFGRTAGLLGALFYVVCPFALFHDRLAVADVFLSAAAGWVLVASLDLAAARSVGVGLGVFLGLGILAKALGVVLLTTPPLALLAMGAPGRVWKRLWVPYAVAGAIAGWPLWFFLRKTAELGEKAALGAEGGDLAVALDNAASAALVLAEWWTWGISAVVCVGLLIALRRHRGVGLVFLWSVLASTVLVALTARVWYPRYLLFATGPALAAAGLGAASMLRAVPARMRWLAVAALLVAGYQALRLDVALLINPASALLPEADLRQYVNGWSSGYGIREAAEYVRSRSAQAGGRVLVVVPRLHERGVFLGLKTYLRSAPGIRLVEGWPRAESDVEFGEVLVAVPPGMPASALAIRGMRPLTSFKKPDGSSAVDVYAVEGSVAEALGRLREAVE